MKKRPVSGELYCWSSVTLPPAAMQAPVTVWTMPGRSSQEMVSVQLRVCSVTTTAYGARRVEGRDTPAPRMAR